MINNNLWKLFHEKKNNNCIKKKEWKIKIETTIYKFIWRWTSNFIKPWSRLIRNKIVIKILVIS